MTGTKRVVALAAVVAAVFCVPSESARAGYYVVEACQSASGWGYGSNAFELDRSTGLLPLGRACGKWGRIGREPGLSAVAGRKRGRARYGAYARALFRAPPGMRIARVEWTGMLKRCDNDWTAAVLASGGGPTRTVLLPGPPFTPRCDAHAYGSAAPRPVALPRVANSTAIFSQVRCGNRRGCDTSPLRRGEVRADARTFGARITLADPAPPTVWNVGGALKSGRWLRGEQVLRFNARDDSGISLEEVRSSAGGALLGNNPRRCNLTNKVPCPPTALGTIRAETSTAPDGPQTLKLRVHDAAGQPTEVRFPAAVDNHPPTAVATSVTGGEGWHRSGPFSVAWQNPPEPGRAPITAAYYQLRRAGTAVWSSPVQRTGAGLSRLSLPVEPGEWDLRMWRADAAGNASAGSASTPVKLRYDNEVPALGFEAQNSSDPARVSVLAAERVSGLRSGAIEIRREGDAAWLPVPTQISGTRLVARLDDATLPAGLYALRARASDQAGNVGFGERRAAGFPAVISLPARGRSTLLAGAVARRTVTRRARRGRHRRLIRRRVVRLVPSLRARHGRRVVVQGTLRGPSGAPLAATVLRASEQPELAPARQLLPIRTDSGGRFRIVMSAARNATLSIVYPGTAGLLPSRQTVTMKVPAASAIRASKRRVRNGGGVTFKGQVRTLPIPAAGKLVEIQAHFRGRWRTFQTIRSGADGGWRFRYRFGATSGRVRYRFRALLGAEGGYPFVRGASRTVRVTVNG